MSIHSTLSSTELAGNIISQSIPECVQKNKNLDTTSITNIINQLPLTASLI